VRGRGCRVAAPAGELYLGNNGTGIRFLASVAALAPAAVRLTGTPRMAQRPIGPLLEALRGWGVRAESLHGTGCPPVEVHGGGIEGGETRLDASKSSQFLSSLLLAAPCARRPAEIVLSGPLVSRPYVDLTTAVMAAFGVRVEVSEDRRFRVPRRAYRPADYAVEGDASSASYFWAAAAVTGGRVTVANVPAEALQGDAAFADLLGRMGCRVEKSAEGVTVEGPPEGELRGIEVDMGRWPDVVPTLAVVAAFARGETVVTGVAHLRIKESDRIRSVVTELVRLGVSAEERPDGLVVRGGGRLRPAEVATYDDHRMAMSFAVAGLRVPGLRIRDPGCVAKSFPGFWEVFEGLVGAGA
ncbi:3-phosphoshikimate 1-carboxyvinyltransferase, partial [Dissulfurirhabdus thermomarina]